MTALEWLVDKILVEQEVYTDKEGDWIDTPRTVYVNAYKDYVELNDFVEEALEMERQQINNTKIIDMMRADDGLGLYEEYAEFCVRSDREGLPLLKAEDWFDRYKLTSKDQINAIIDTVNTQGKISEGDKPVLIVDDCTCSKCGKESRGSHSCPYDEEFNSGYELDSCNCCDSCRRECLMDI